MAYDPTLIDAVDRLDVVGLLLSPMRIRELLSHGRVKWPKGISVVDVSVKEGRDWNGDPSLFILLLVPDKTSEKVLSSTAVGHARFAVGEALRAEGERRFPYVRVLREREPAEHEAIRAAEDDES